MLVRIGFAPGYIDPPKISPLFGNLDKVGILEFGKPGAAFTSDLAADLVDVIIEKHGIKLDAALRAKQVDHFVTAGVSSVPTVQSTVRKAHDRDCTVSVIEGACAAADEEDHKAAMKQLRMISTISRLDDLGVQRSRPARTPAPNSEEAAS